MGRIIGLLGGIGAGKSTVARLLAERGLLVVDADAEAREAVEEPGLRAALAERFGADVLDGAGHLDRALLAERAFADPAATEALNALVHPEVRRRIEARLEAAGERPVVLDVPLLLESPLAERVTDWVFVEADEARREALIRGRNWPPGERERREARQADPVAKRRRADHVLENPGTIDDLGKQLDALLQKLGLDVPARDRRDAGP